MKKCTQCGKHWPDTLTTCPDEFEPLVPLESGGENPESASTSPAFSSAPIETEQAGSPLLAGFLLLVAVGILIAMNLISSPAPAFFILNSLVVLLGAASTMMGFLGSNNRERAISWNKIFIVISGFAAVIAFLNPRGFVGSLFGSLDIMGLTIVMLMFGGLSCILAIWALNVQKHRKTSTFNGQPTEFRNSQVSLETLPLVNSLVVKSDKAESENCHQYTSKASIVMFTILLLFVFSVIGYVTWVAIYGG
jgi:hypothetical protein